MVLAVAACAQAETDPALPKLQIDKARVTVSGISSGAYMAQQVQIALGERIAGAGLIAGGPYGCAHGDLGTALKACMAPPAPGPDVAALAETVKARAAAGAVAPLETLRGDRVYVFHGTGDTLVGESVTRASAALYAALGEPVSVTEEFSKATAHVFPTAEQGGDCHKTAAPYIGKCGVDAAAAIFQALYPEVSGKDAATAGTGKVVSFAQARYVVPPGDPQLGETGYAYVPAACEKERCGLHIVFHGCEQSAGELGTAFVEQTGYARWADAARVVVLYPQVAKSLQPLNPKACWDWWGYTGVDYDTRTGAQIRYVGELIDALVKR